MLGLGFAAQFVLFFNSTIHIIVSFLGSLLIE